MNAQRRKRLAKVEELLSEAGSLLEDIISEEREALDNMPDSIRESDRGEEMEEKLSYLEDCFSSLEDSTSSLSEVLG